MARCLYLLQPLGAAGIDTSSELEMSKQDLYQFLDTFSPERNKGQVRQKSAVIAGAEWCTDIGAYQNRGYLIYKTVVPGQRLISLILLFIYHVVYETIVATDHTRRVASYAFPSRCGQLKQKAPVDPGAFNYRNQVQASGL